ncbi:hypothetical protein HY345_00060 [Candidatus Microgenomates bacterium]|nr:hypothetical protein [Candidatus Microgenomates bacterium]
MSQENGIVHEQGESGRVALVLKSREHLKRASGIFETHGFSLATIENLIDGNYETMTVVSGPTRKTWPDVDPVETFEERIIKTSDGVELERSNCHFNRIETRNDQIDGKPWRFLNISTRITPQGKPTPIEIIHVTGGYGMIYFSDKIQGDGGNFRGSKTGRVIELEPGMTVVVTEEIGNAISGIGKDGLDFIYVSSPPYEDVETALVKPEVEIV